MSRHLMEPDPDLGPVDAGHALGLTLWIVVLVLAAVVTVAVRS